MSKCVTSPSRFRLVGKFLGFEDKKGKSQHYLRLYTDKQEYLIKVSKKLRQSITTSSVSGMRLEVIGKEKISKKTGKLKLKAQEIRQLHPNQETVSSSPLVPSIAQSGKILVCQKSDCWKRGGKAICQQLEKSLSDRGLADTVTVKTTGCLKACGKSPNVVFLPDKTHYKRAKPQEMDELVAKHFAS